VAGQRSELVRVRVVLRGLAGTDAQKPSTTPGRVRRAAEGAGGLRIHVQVWEARGG
jgi:hypothetical protein